MGWDSYTASAPVASVPLGNVQALPYNLSLEQTYVGYSALINEPLSNAELTELAQFRPFDTDGGNANIQIRFSNLRRAVLDGINVIGRDEPKVADSLYSSYRNKRLSLAFSDDFKLDSQLRDDGTSEYGDESVNLFDFPCSDTPSVILKLYDPQMFRLINTLSLEGLRTVQTRYTGAFPTTQINFAQWSLANQLAEVNVATKILAYYSFMSNYFNSIAISLQLPVGANGLGAHFGGAILNDNSLTSIQKQDAARNLLVRLEGEYKPKEGFYLQMRQFYRDGLQNYIAGQLPGASYNHFMRRTAWYDSTTKRDTGEFRRITLTAGSGQFSNPSTLVTHNYFRQIAVRVDGTKAEFTHTLAPLNSIAGAYRWGSRFLVGGDSATTSEGVIWGFRDTNDDGLLEENTGREVLRSTMFYGGYSILKHPVSNAKYVFSRVSNKLFELTGSDVDGFPTSFTDRGTLTTTKNDLLSARISYTGDWAVGLSDYNIPVDKYSFAVEARYNTTTTKYEHYRHSYPFTESQVSPALAETPVPNTSYLEATGTPGTWLNAYKVNGGMTLIESAQVDPNGHVAFQAASPLLAGEALVLKDLQTDYFSPNYFVPNTIVPKFHTPRLTGYDRVQFQAVAQPNYLYDLQYGTDPGDLVTGWTYNSPRSGNVFWGTTLSDNDTMFVAGVVRVPTTTGTTDYYRVAPGSSQQYHPKINDRYSVGAAFGLTTPSTLDPERFSFALHGRFSYTALTLSASYSFNYRINDVGQTSPPVNVVILADYPGLVNPPVLVDPGTGIQSVQAPCLVLGGLHYPIYQFNCGNGAADVCTSPHWHSFGLVYPLEPPGIGIPDPNPSSCGFGKVSQVPFAIVPTSISAWSDFKVAHVPPLSFSGDAGKISANEELCRPDGSIKPVSSQSE